MWGLSLESIPLNKIETPETWEMTCLILGKETHGNCWCNHSSRLPSLLESCQKKSIGRASILVLRILKKGFNKKCEKYLPDKMENRGTLLGNSHRKFEGRWNIKETSLLSLNNHGTTSERSFTGTKEFHVRFHLKERISATIIGKPLY